MSYYGSIWQFIRVKLYGLDNTVEIEFTLINDAKIEKIITMDIKLGNANELYTITTYRYTNLVGVFEVFTSSPGT